MPGRATQGLQCVSYLPRRVMPGRATQGLQCVSYLPLSYLPFNSGSPAVRCKLLD
jgi:hypothetical protein